MKQRVSRHDMLMMMANAASLRSTCSRNQVGVIVAMEARPMVSGYNGTPATMPHCDHECNCRAVDKYSDRVSECSNTCASIMPCLLVVHAEANAIAYAAKYGVQLLGTTLFTTLSPCYTCAQLIINAGIVEVVYEKAYRDASGIQLLKDARIKVCQHTV